MALIVSCAKDDAGIVHVGIERERKPPLRMQNLCPHSLWFSVVSLSPAERDAAIKKAPRYPVSLHFTLLLYPAPSHREAC